MLSTRLSKDGNTLDVSHEELLGVAHAIGGEEGARCLSGFLNKPSDQIKADRIAVRFPWSLILCNPKADHLSTGILH
jgi:hypothetical protein